MNDHIARQRLQNQCIAGAPRRTAADVVAWFGAVQAQEYPVAKWGLALRMPDGTTDTAIQRAFDTGRILRTHVMRPTWHFVTPRDIRWLLHLTASRVHQRMQPYNRQLELDRATLTRAAGIIERALGGGRHLTRLELADRLARAGIAARGQRLAHVVMHAELEGVICSGPRRDTQFTYALLAERAPKARRLTRDESLAELVGRFFRSHAPATVRDFVWWSGLTTIDAKRGLEMMHARRSLVDGLTYWSIGDVPAARTRRRRVHLLPVYDEYLVAYRDRQAVPHWWTGMAVPSAFQHPLIVDCQVAGTWRPARTGEGVKLEVHPVKALPAHARRALLDAAARFGRFADSRTRLAVSVGRNVGDPMRASARIRSNSDGATERRPS